jgi:hypothetical protein
MSERLTVKPPRLAEYFLSSFAPEPICNNLSGDLLEIFNLVIVPSSGVFKARLWYWRQVAGSMRLLFRVRRRSRVALGYLNRRTCTHGPAPNSFRLHPGISMHHISVGGDLPGLLFVLATVFIFGFAFPAFLTLLAISGTLGLFASRILLHWNQSHALEIQVLSLTKLK